MSAHDAEQEALQDIAARPQVSERPEGENGQKREGSAQDAPEKPAPGAHDLEPDEVESKIGRVMAKAGSNLYEGLGQELDRDVADLAGDCFSGLLALGRFMGGWWIRLLAAPVAIGFFMMPAVIKYAAKKKEEKKENEP